MLVTGMSLFELRFLMDNFPQEFAEQKVFDGAHCASVGVKYHATVKLPRGREAIVTSVNRYITMIEGVDGVEDKSDPDCEAVKAYDWHDVVDQGSLDMHGEIIKKAIEGTHNIVGYKPVDQLDGSERLQMMASLLSHRGIQHSKAVNVKVHHTGRYDEEMTIHAISTYLS